jgi:iron complex transport system substrate-binding protein
VATVSWVNDDVAIALGVVPVGVPKNDWGGNDQGSTPWKDAALADLGAGFGSDKAPVQYSEADGINFTEIAKLSPDVILAAYSGLTEEDYKKLSEIAPVVAHPELAYGTSWQDATTIVGKALGKDAEAAKLVSDTEATVKAEAAKYPQIEGKSFIYGYALPSDPTQTGIYTANDNRPKFLSSIGMKLAPVAEQASAGSKEFFVPWSAERPTSSSRTSSSALSRTPARQTPSRMIPCWARSRPSRTAPSSRTRTRAWSWPSPLPLR